MVISTSIGYRVSKINRICTSKMYVKYGGLLYCVLVEGVRIGSRDHHFYNPHQILDASRSSKVSTVIIFIHQRCATVHTLEGRSRQVVGFFYKKWALLLRWNHASDRQVLASGLKRSSYCLSTAPQTAFVNSHRYVRYHLISLGNLQSHNFPIPISNNI